MIRILSILLAFALACCNKKSDPRTQYFPTSEHHPSTIPSKQNLWVFIMAGQSNMAGRGQVEAQDTVPDPRILTINSRNEFILAKEPLHLYEPSKTGLDCGLSFGKALLKQIPDSVSILLLPVAIGGTSLDKWLGDSLHRGVRLLENYREKILFAEKWGTLKGMLWHQGEQDATAEILPVYGKKLAELFGVFRAIAHNDTLPILAAQLGSYSKFQPAWDRLNAATDSVATADPYTFLIKVDDLNHIGDHIHFDAAAQRELGRRFARAFSGDGGMP